MAQYAGWIFFFVNLIQIMVIWKEGTSVEKIPPSDQPVGKSVGEFS